jgi:TonB family protein
MPEKMLFEGATAKSEGMLSRLRTGLAAAFEPSSGTPGEVPGDAPVHFEMVREQSVFQSLGRELGFAVEELRRDPKGFVAAVVSPDVNDPDQQRTRRAAFALTLAVPALAAGAFMLGLILWSIFGWVPEPEVAASTDEQIKELVLAGEVEMPEMPKQEKRAGGGGGGGNKAPTPPSKGKPPTPSLAPPVLAPTTQPTPRPPSLPTLPTVQVDPKLLPPNPDPNSLGDPKGIEGPPSDGPGEGRGIGTGKGGGVGSGEGTGVGPGRGFNMGGGDPSLGGGDADALRKAVTKAQILNSPRPNYTEQARVNKTQGTVAVRVLLGGNGTVKSAKVVRGLPDGLNEEAIKAVYKLKFVPAKNGAGQGVDSWLTVSVTFNLR